MRLKMRRGSVMMEGVIVLPLWLIIFGGIMTLGQKGMDVLRVKASERFAAESIINREGAAGPSSAFLMTSPAFLDRGLATAQAKRVLNRENSYLAMVGGGARLDGERATDLFSDMMAQPMYGLTKDGPQSATSSRKGNTYTSFMLARSARSTLSRRHWDAGLIVDKGIWKFSNDDDDNNDYPESWNADFFNRASDKERAAPDGRDYRVVPLYERFDAYMEWSGGSSNE